MRKSIATAAAALVVAGTAFMACGCTSEYDSGRERIDQRSAFHARLECVQSEMRLRGQKGIEVTEEDRRELEHECLLRQLRG